ncbi:MAG: hypothetical protein ABFD97_11600 [Syntrophobacter sp.]
MTRLLASFGIENTGILAAFILLGTGAVAVLVGSASFLAHGIPRFTRSQAAGLYRLAAFLAALDQTGVDCRFITPAQGGPIKGQAQKNTHDECLFHFTLNKTEMPVDRVKIAWNGRCLRRAPERKQNPYIMPGRVFRVQN